MSASSSPGSSPAKPSSKAQLPASVANASLEELQKLFVDSLKKLKARDRRIAELSASNEGLQNQASQKEKASQQQLQQQLESALHEAEEAGRRASDAEQQFEGMYKQYTAQQQQIDEAAAEKAVQSEQMASLKEVLRTLALEKDTAGKVSIIVLFYCAQASHHQAMNS